MRDLGIELLAVLAICAVAAVGIFVWRGHPAIVWALIATLTIAAGWLGNKVESVRHPDKSRAWRFFIMPAVYGAIALIGAIVLWGGYCPCASR